MTIETWLLVAFLAFFFGYAFGHRHGKDEGFRDGIVFGPIEMRRRSLERGRCLVCGTGVDDQELTENKQGNEEGYYHQRAK